MTETETNLAGSQEVFSEKAESALVAQAQRDPQAFGAIYRLYIQPVFRYLYSRTGSRPEAEDATAQTFLAALDGLPRYRHNGHFAAWLFAIARRKAADQFRARRGQLPLEEMPEIPVEADYLQEAIQAERIEALRAAVAGLAESERELLRLRYVAGLPFAQISRLVGRNEDAVKKALYRLLGRLHNQLEDTHD